jgi:hypothetical protein
MNTKKSRVGERRKTNMGLFCEIIEYINSENITVMFDGGIIKHNVTYYDFSVGRIKCPMVYERCPISKATLCFNPNTGGIFLIDTDCEHLLGSQHWNVGFRGKVASDSTKLATIIIGKEVPKGQHIHHINHSRIDNRRKNLTIVNYKESLYKTTKRRGNSYTSKYKGVFWRSKNNTWCARIQKDGKASWLGSFINEEDAARAYDKAAIELFGEFAHQNLTPNLSIFYVIFLSHLA